MGAFSLRIRIYISDLLTRVHLRLATELPCLCLCLETASLFSCLRSPSFYFVRMRLNYLLNIAPITTGVEYTVVFFMAIY